MITNDSLVTHKYTEKFPPARKNGKPRLIEKKYFTYTYGKYLVTFKDHARGYSVKIEADSEVVFEDNTGLAMYESKIKAFRMALAMANSKMKDILSRPDKYVIGEDRILR